MALARIISRSHESSRELAFDLLARGYAVEIVSPDAVPDSLADLELRVDTDSADALAAAVEAHEGSRPDSLDFLQHLRAPMGKFIRRTPSRNEPASIAAPAMRTPVISAPVTPAPVIPAPVMTAPVIATPAIAKPTIEERKLVEVVIPQLILEVESPSVAHESPETSEEICAPIADEVHFSGLPSEAAPLETLPLHPIEETVSAEEIATPVIAVSDREPRTSFSIPEWAWRAGMTFAGVLIFALVLGFGIRKGSGDAAPALQSEIVAPDSSAQELAAQNQTAQNQPARGVSGSAVAASAPVATNSVRASVKDHTATPTVAKAPVAKAPVATTGDAVIKAAQSQSLKTSPAIHAAPRPTTSHSRGEDVIAHDTVTYLDKSFAPKSKNKTKSLQASRNANSAAHKATALKTSEHKTAAHKTTAPKAKAVAHKSKPSPRQPASSARKPRRTSDGIIAADTVTYLNGKAPKTSRP